MLEYVKIRKGIFLLFVYDCCCWFSLHDFCWQFAGTLIMLLGHKVCSDIKCPSTSLEHFFRLKTRLNSIFYTRVILIYQAISWPVYSYSFPESPSLNEPKHDKTNKMSVRPAKTQISLGIRPVWSKASMCAQSKTKDPRFLHADSEDSDQTGRMPRLIWVFAGRTLILLVLSCRGSNVDSSFRISRTLSS